MGAAGTKAKRTAEKPSPSPQNGATPDTRLTDVLDLLKNLSDPICLRVLALADEMSSVAEIGAAVAQDKPAITDHLNRTTQEGKWLWPVTTHVSAWFGRDERPPTSGVSPIRRADRTHVRGWRFPVRTTVSRPWSRVPQRRARGRSSRRLVKPGSYCRPVP